MVLPWRTKATGVRSTMAIRNWSGSSRMTVACSTQGSCSKDARRSANGMKKMLRPRSDPKTERSSDRVTWLLPMIWMEEEAAMRKRGSSRKKLRIPIASNTSPPIATTKPAAAAMRPQRLVGISPRRTGTRRRARRKASSSRSALSPVACPACLRAALRPDAASCGVLARVVDAAAGR